MVCNDELRWLGAVHLDKGDGYFYFWKGEANNWLDRAVSVPKVSSLTLEEWIEEFNRLKKLNGSNAFGQDAEEGPARAEVNWR